MEELYYTASCDEENIYIKAVNVRENEVTSQIRVDGVDSINGEISDLSGLNPDDMNDFDNPTKVCPKTSSLVSYTNTFDYTFPPQSVTVFKIKR